MTTKLILASKSPFRSALLKNAGIEFLAESADIDERSVEAPLYKSGATPEEVAQVLAEAKALSVSENNPDAVVIGCDQTLSLGMRFSTSLWIWKQRGASCCSFRARHTSSTAAWFWLKRRDAVASCFSGTNDDARSRSGFCRSLSRSGWRRCSFQCWRLSGRRSGHSAFRENRRRLFHHRRTAASAPA